MKNLIISKIEDRVLMKFLKLKLKYENEISNISFKEKLRNKDENIYDFKERYIEELNNLAFEISNEALKISFCKSFILFSFLNEDQLFKAFENSFKSLNDDLNIFLSKNLYLLQVYINEEEEKENFFINDWSH
jgi:hypothetical protein